MPDAERPVHFMFHVMVVEDDFELSDLLCEVLTYENCIPDPAANGIDALDRLRTGHYDAVICDLMMPRMDGEALYREATKDHPYLAEKFLFITGQAAHIGGMADFVFRTGNPLLAKPFEIDEFRTVLRELLAR